MSKGTLLRKSGVAIRKETTPKKRSTGLPKPAELRKKIAIAEAKKNKNRRVTQKHCQRGGANYISDESESESDSQPLATSRIGVKLPLATLPTPIIESTEQTNSRCDERTEANAQIRAETPEGEHNKGGK